MAVNVKKVAGRRSVKICTYDDIQSDAESLMRGGRIRSLGNWTAGQNFEHLAKSMDACIDGVDFQLAWPMRMLASLFRNRFLNSPFKPGFQLPVKMEPAFGPSESISDEDGFRKLVAAIQRLKTTAKRAPSPAFGEMPESDWIKLHCRHAELHLSFLVND